ncbi:MAG: hypothetical protein ACTSU2_05260 [Promethearchaeota archaeon]
MSYYTPFAIFWGIVSTISLHIAKAMERQGIEIYDQIRAKMGLENEGEHIEKDIKKPVIYIIGLVLNNTVPLWAILATMRGDPSSYYTSMFGLGLIALMIYSSKVLKEKITTKQYIGAGILISGTLIIGIESILRPSYDLSKINVVFLWVILAIFLIVGFTSMGLALKAGSPNIIGIVFGLFAGGCGGWDPILKGLGQAYGVETSGFFPKSPIGWFIFIFSFLFGFFGFFFTQWGFARKSNASVLVPSYNSLYVAFPIIIYALVLPGFTIYPTTIVALILIIIGIVMIQMDIKSEPIPTSNNDTSQISNP